MRYIIDNLVRVAKRENNTKRPYLYVDPLQGKHIPASPGEILGMCRALADIVNERHANESLYVIGFAETATGIAAGVCGYLKNAVYYQNTTREYREGGSYLHFTESHSHAEDQLLRADGIETALKSCKRVIFIDDEITTGNTVLKLIDVIEKNYDTSGLNYSIVSILNSMTEERVKELSDKGIDCLFLAKLPFEYNIESISDVGFDERLHTVAIGAETSELNETAFVVSQDPRDIIKFRDYDNEIAGFTERLSGGERCESMLILGTEECMFPAVRLGDAIERSGLVKRVKVHATTRSPITACEKQGYPLNHRYQLRSLYDESRTTFIYDIKKYDKVIILTDSQIPSKGIYDLCSALKSVGNDNITVIRLKYEQ